MGNGLVAILDYDTWKPRRKIYDHPFNKKYVNYVQPTVFKLVRLCLTIYIATWRAFSLLSMNALTNCWRAYDLWQMGRQQFPWNNSCRKSQWMSSVRYICKNRLYMCLHVHAYLFSCSNSTSQVAFGSDFSGKWDDATLGLKCVKGNGKLTFLVGHALEGLQKSFAGGFGYAVSYSWYPRSILFIQSKISLFMGKILF